MKNIHLLLFGLFLISMSCLNAQDKDAEFQKELNNKDFTSALNLAKSILDNGDAQDAIKLLIKIQATGYTDKKVYEYLGDCYSKTGINELANLNYQQAEDLDSLDINVKMKLAEILFKQKRYTDAVNKYLKIIAIDPQNPKPYLQAAQIFYAAKYYADASTMYEKYLALEQTKEAYEKITDALLETKNYDKAFQYALEGTAKYQNDFQISKNAATAAFYLKKYDQAAKYFSSVPDSILSSNELVNTAKSFQQIKSDSSALVYFQKAVKRDSTLSNIYMDIANYNYMNKNYEEAVNYYSAKIKSDSTYEPAYRFLAFSLMQMQKHDETRLALKKSIALNDTLVTTRYWLAQTYRQMDSLSAAADTYEKMLQLIGSREAQYKNESAEAYGFLGQRAFEKKNYSGAVGLLKKAVALKNDILAYKVMLASSLHQSGEINDAIYWYKKILIIDPKNEVAKKGLRMLSAD